MNGKRFNPRSFWRFSLRTALALFLILSVSLGFLARWYHQVRERGDAQDWLIEHSDHSSSNWRSSSMHCLMKKETQTPWTTSLIRKWVHPEYDVKFETISVGRESIKNEFVSRIEKMFGVERLYIYGLLRPPR